MEEESLVRRRSKRSTAGNRMEAALAEFQAEELGQDVEDDIDFVVEKDEQDLFEVDFESTDEEGAQEDVDAAAEKMVREDEKKAKKASRSQLDKVTAAAHARQKATFNPQLAENEASKTSGPSKPKRHVSLGAVVDAETGRVMRGAKRHSQRTYTMLSTSMADARFRDELEKKSTSSKRTKVKITPPTQAELIARALDMEEGNIREHRNYLTLEEEKRKKARLVRETVDGPLVRWISKAEKAEVQVEVPRQPLYVPQPYVPSMPYAPSNAAGYAPPISYPQAIAPMPSTGVPPYTPYIQSPYVASPPQPGNPINPAAPSFSVSETREVTVCKNYVVHENEQREGAPRPLWKDTMAAMFGDHVNWEELKVYTGKGRPLSRYTLQCPITGLPGKYIDPRTNVPYANARAYGILTHLLSHEYAWNEALGCYAGTEATDRASSE